MPWSPKLYPCEATSDSCFHPPHPAPSPTLSLIFQRKKLVLRKVEIEAETRSSQTFSSSGFLADLQNDSAPPLSS